MALDVFVYNPKDRGNPAMSFFLFFYRFGQV